MENLLRFHQLLAIMALVDDILHRCLSGPFKGELTAQNVSLYYSSPYAIFCEKFVPETEKDPPSPYRELLLERGAEHEERAIQKHYPDAASFHYETPQEGFSLLLKEMARGVDTILGLPLFYLPENLQGQVDALVKRTDHPSSFGPYHYVVLEIKLAKNMRNDHILQAAFYTYILGKIQGYTPGTFLLMNRDQHVDAYLFEDYRESLAQAISRTQAILAGHEKPTATYNGCGWPWTTYTNRQAIKNRDVSLISQVGQQTKNKLMAQGFKRVRDVAAAQAEDLSAILGVRPGKAAMFIRSARAIENGEPIPINVNALDFPERSTEIFLDLEGTDQPAAQDELVQVDYLIGILIRKRKKEAYRPFIAHCLQDEDTMFRDFIGFIREQDDYVIYHWHSYERWHIKQLGERYGLMADVETLLLPHMIDLHKTATRAFIFPTYRNGLKDIADFLGFKWRHDDVNALDAIAYYLRYQQDPEGFQNRMQAIVDYNEDDCTATKAIKDWLYQASKERV